MRDQKGYTLIELLVVLVIMLLVILLIALAILSRIDEAHGSTVINEARAVYITAQTVILEIKAELLEVSDGEYMAGLSGTADDASFPIETRLSQMMTALLAPDVVLSDEPSAGTAQVSFVVEDGAILSLSYEKMIGNRHYIVTIEHGETTIMRNK